MSNNNFNGDLGHYEIINTEDGTQTIYSSHFNENCHSLSGATEETLCHYIQGTNLLSKDTPIILEVGFGAGLGFFTTLKECQKVDKYFIFHSLELDEGLIQHVKSQNPLFADLVKSNNCYSLNTKQFELKVFLGDARTTIEHLDNDYYNCIFQDPFSPKRNPTLWTWQWFEQLYNKSSTECDLSTYSASLGVRKAMIKAGWNIKKGSGFGKKRSSTRASRKKIMCQALFDELQKSSAQAYSD